MLKGRVPMEGHVKALGPDMPAPLTRKKMLTRVVPRPRSSLSCVMALKMSHYTGPPELLSMFLCVINLLGASNAEKLPRLQPDELERARRKYKATFKQNPVSRKLLSMFD